MTTLAATRPTLVASGRNSSISSHADDKEQVPTPLPNAPVEQADEELTKLRVLLILIMTGMLMFLVALDKTIIGVALPSISSEFRSLNDVGWYGSAYMATTAAFQLVWGRIYKANPVKPTFLIAVLIFEIGSAVCGAAPTSKGFIVGRAVAGAGGAGIMNGAISILMAVVPLEKRAAAQASFGAVFGIASALGPLLGGAFTQRVSWRWCFYINLPFAVVAILPVIFFLDGKKTADKGKTTPPFRQQIRQIDPIGVILVLGSIVSLVLALQFGGQASSATSLSSWNTPRVIALLVVFAVALLAFIGWQVYMQDRALLAPKVFVKRSVLGSFWYMWFLAASMTVLFYYVPIWFQVVKGQTPIRSSYSTLASIVPFCGASIIAGIVVKKTGHYAPPMILPPVLGSIGAGLITTWTSTTPEAKWAGYQVLYGLGMGVGMTGSSLAVQAVLPPSDVPLGIAAVFFAREMGSAVFVAAAENLLSSRLVKGLQQIPELNGRAAQLAQSGVAEIRHAVEGMGDRVVGETIEAFTAALRNVWYLVVALTVAMILPFFLIKWLNLNKVGKERAEQAEAAKKEARKAQEEA
ncbi:probable aflatoxin efflux pump AFLT [Sporisorium reilianum f. sp. reilianum]|uniref:Probable aflatoxin efflux pump AFLT n=1 Tax=Sporisorium reilianum f. sp. reilianum TaxID=72559 RepID=A0A2N8U800_9BASI|nr:probable aflatoxin efflux pump AFLT [Sporisorium reilianum f. sp. reilianum]